MMPTSIEELDKIRKECKKIVNKRATTSGVAAVVPIPGSDVAVDMTILMGLFKTINMRFGLTKEQIESLEPKSKALMYTIIKKVGSKLIGQTITKQIIVEVLKKVSVRFATKQVTKYIPFIGQATAAAISYSAMKYVGNSHVEDCYVVVKRYIKNNKSSED